MSFDRSPPRERPTSISGEQTWNRALTLANRAVVSLSKRTVLPFNGYTPGVSKASGFLVHLDRTNHVGIILANRHVMRTAPTRAKARFCNGEELDAVPVFVDPVHDFGFYKCTFSNKYDNDLNDNTFDALSVLELFPPGAKVGASIRIVGYDSSDEHSLSIVSSTLSRIDRDAPRHPAFQANQQLGIGNLNLDSNNNSSSANNSTVANHQLPYCDFNTFYMSAAASSGKVSPGAAAITKEGKCIALCVGSSSKTIMFLPIDKAAKALQSIQERHAYDDLALAIPRGTIQVVFRFKPFRELRKLGLPREEERGLRMQFKNAISGLLVVDQAVVGGPGALAGMKNGDILISVNSKPVFTFDQLENHLDFAQAAANDLRKLRDNSKFCFDYCKKNNFDWILAQETGKLSVNIEFRRGDEVMKVVVDCMDLHSLDANELYQVSGGVLSPLSYSLAYRTQLPVGAVYVASSSLMCLMAGIPKAAVIKSVHKQSNLDLIANNEKRNRDENDDKEAMKDGSDKVIKSKNIRKIGRKSTKKDLKDSSDLSLADRSAMLQFEDDGALGALEADMDKKPFIYDKLVFIDMKTFIQTLQDCSHGDKLLIDYVKIDEPNRVLTAPVFFEAKYFPMKIYIKNDLDSLWYSSVLKKPQQISDVTVPVVSKDELRRIYNINEGDGNLEVNEGVVRSLVSVRFFAPHLMDDLEANSFSGIGYIVDKYNGLVLTSRFNCPSTLGIVRISIASEVIVTGKVIFCHPEMNFSLVQFDINQVKNKSLLSEIYPVLRAKNNNENSTTSLYNFEQLKLNDACTFYGLTSSETKLKIKGCHVKYITDSSSAISVSSPSNKRPRNGHIDNNNDDEESSSNLGSSNAIWPPRFIVRNTPILKMDKSLASLSARGGVYTAANGQVYALFMTAAYPVSDSTSKNERGSNSSLQLQTFHFGPIYEEFLRITNEFLSLLPNPLEKYNLQLVQSNLSLVVNLARRISTDDNLTENGDDDLNESPSVSISPSLSMNADRRSIKKIGARKSVLESLKMTNLSKSIRASRKADHSEFFKESNGIPKDQAASKLETLVSAMPNQSVSPPALPARPVPAGAKISYPLRKLDSIQSIQFTLDSDNNLLSDSATLYKEAEKKLFAYSLGLSLSSVPISKVRDAYGLYEKRVTKLTARLDQKGSERKHILKISGVMDGSAPGKLLRAGDLLLEINNKTVVDLEDVSFEINALYAQDDTTVVQDGKKRVLKKFLTVVVQRQQKEIKQRVYVEKLSVLGTQKIAYIGGMLAQHTYPLVQYSARLPVFKPFKKGVYVVQRLNGSPAQEAGLPVHCWITHVNEQEVQDLEQMLSALDASSGNLSVEDPDSGYVRLRTVDRKSKERIITMKLDTWYSPTTIIERDMRTLEWNTEELL